MKKVRSRGFDTLTAVCWKDKRVVYILAFMKLKLMEESR